MLNLSDGGFVTGRDVGLLVVGFEVGLLVGGGDGGETRKSYFITVKSSSLDVTIRSPFKSSVYDPGPHSQHIPSPVRDLSLILKMYAPGSKQKSPM